MEEFHNNNYKQKKLIKEYFKPDYSALFNRIKQIKTPVKNDILIGLLDGNWHSELDLIRIARKQQKYMGAVTLGTMVNSLNHALKTDYVEKKVVNDKIIVDVLDMDLNSIDSFDVD